MAEKEEQVIIEKASVKRKPGKTTTLKSKGKNVKAVEVEVVSTPIEEVEGKIETSLKPQVLSPKAQRMRDTLASQKKMLVHLPPETEFPEYSVADKFTRELHDSYGEPHAVCVNGYNYFVPKGVPVEVPETVYFILKQQRDFKNEEARAMAARMKALKQSFINE